MQKTGFKVRTKKIFFFLFDFFIDWKSKLDDIQDELIVCFIENLLY